MFSLSVSKTNLITIHRADLESINMDLIQVLQISHHKKFTYI